MPTRQTALITGNTYHIFNKCLEKNIPFNKAYYASYFLNTLTYYRSLETPFSYSKLKHLDSESQKNIQKRLANPTKFQIEILAYCLMPNHYHILLKQLKTNGVSRYIGTVVNAFTRFYNLTKDRKGPLFLTNFKAVEITTQEQLIHTSRYIHLNPYTAGLVRTIKGLRAYKWTSYREYLGTGKKRNNLCHKSELLDYFQGDIRKYTKFVEDNADYQKTLSLLEKM